MDLPPSLNDLSTQESRLSTLPVPVCQLGNLKKTQKTSKNISHSHHSPPSHGGRRAEG